MSCNFVAHAPLPRFRWLSYCSCLAALLGATGCLCPPCAAGPAETPSSAAPAAAPSTTAAAAGAPAAAVASGDREVLWDGDTVARGQGWASCDQEAQGCKSTLAPAPGEGVGGSTGLKLHGEGTGWQGGGWNWFGWWPQDAGTDISGYDDLTFSIKVSAPAKDQAPNADAINFAFGCSRDKKNSADAPLGKYVADAANGQWHEVKIPLSDFFAGKGAECDPRTAWEIRASSWSGTPVAFDLVLDDIAVVKR